MSNLSPHMLYIHYAQHRKNYLPSYIFPSRITQSYELSYFLPGSACKMVLDNKTYHLKGNTVVLRKPGQSNQSFMPYESIWMGFTFDTDHHTLIDHPLLNGIETITTNLQQANYHKLFEDLYKESLLNRTHANHYYTAKIMEILYNLYNESNTNIIAHQSPIGDDTLISILNYIELHLTESFTVKTLSSQLSISERHIYNLFKTHLKVTPIQYITESKINYAMNLIKTSNLPIHVVAQMCGYENSTYFISLFKKNVGLTPLTYRKGLIT